VKKQHTLNPSPTIIFCYDGSDIAYEGLLDMLEVCQNIKAKLVVAHAESADTIKSTNIIRHQIRELKKISKDIDLDLTVLEAREWGPQRTLLEYLREQQNKVDLISVYLPFNEANEERQQRLTNEQSLRRRYRLFRAGGHRYQPDPVEMTACLSA
jgi:arabinogalactan endo-1,4-beta-galactosidase